MESLLGEVSGQKKDEQYLTTPGVAAFGAGGSPLPAMLLPVLKSLDPQRAKLVLQGFQQLQILHSERVSLTMPIFGVSPKADSSQAVHTFNAPPSYGGALLFLRSGAAC